MHIFSNLSALQARATSFRSTMTMYSNATPQSIPSIPLPRETHQDTYGPVDLRVPSYVSPLSLLALHDPRKKETTCTSLSHYRQGKTQVGESFNLLLVSWSCFNSASSLGSFRRTLTIRRISRMRRQKRERHLSRACSEMPRPRCRGERSGRTAGLLYFFVLLFTFNGLPLRTDESILHVFECPDKRYRRVPLPLHVET